MTHALTLIGYWHSLFDAGYPDPAWFIDKHWDAQIKAKVIAHLEQGRPMPYTYVGESWCRFRCDLKTGITHLGAGEYTDGRYVWPEGLAHYVKHHDVRLPDEVVNFMLSEEQLTYDLESTTFETDHEWWKSQQGWNRANASSKGPDIGCIIITAINDAFKAEQEKALLYYLSKSGGIKGKLTAVEQVLSGATTTVKGRFGNVHNFIKEVEAIGLDVKFKEMTFVEYQLSEG